MGGENESAILANEGSPVPFLQAVQRPFRWPEAWLFVAASTADIALTYVLIGRHGHYESNPIAAWFVYGWGLKGMVRFKAVLVLLVLGIATTVSRTHLHAARSVVRIGAVGALMVVGYSVALLLRSS